MQWWLSLYSSLDFRCEIIRNKCLPMREKNSSLLPRQISAGRNKQQAFQWKHESSNWSRYGVLHSKILLHLQSPALALAPKP